MGFLKHFQRGSKIFRQGVRDFFNSDLPIECYHMLNLFYTAFLSFIWSKEKKLSIHYFFRDGYFFYSLIARKVNFIIFFEKR